MAEGCARQAGPALTVGPDRYSVTSGLSAIEIRMQGTVLQARVPDLGDDLVVSASLDGTIDVTSAA